MCVCVCVCVCGCVSECVNVCVCVCATVCHAFQGVKTHYVYSKFVVNWDGLQIPPPHRSAGSHEEVSKEDRCMNG